MVLLDKGYYDYDYEETGKTATPCLFEETVKSDEEVRGILAGFGFRQFAEKAPETLDEIQEYIIKQESYGS